MHGRNRTTLTRKRFLSPIREAEEIPLGSSPRSPIVSAKGFPVLLSLTGLRPSAIKESFEPHTAPSLPRHADGDTQMSGVLLPCHGLPTAVNNGDFHLTGNALS
jgi:hypothetical protein